MYLARFFSPFTKKYAFTRNVPYYVKFSRHVYFAILQCAENFVIGINMTLIFAFLSETLSIYATLKSNRTTSSTDAKN